MNFTGIEKFPDTGIYYLKPDRKLFDEMHKAIVCSGLEFNESPWPYNPHCTLCWKNESTPEIDAYFKTIEVPEKATIECFSLYQPENRGGYRAHKF